MRVRPWLARWLLNLYPPYLGAGVRIRRISADWQELDVAMKLHWYNRNAVGVHFGGSLYSMIDPHLMLLLMQQLGPDYLVWDQAARIEFLKPGRGEVRAAIRLPRERTEQIRAEAADGAPCRPEFEIQIEDSDGTAIARVHKTLYVRRKNPKGRTK